jgi:hypothetical protein
MPTKAEMASPCRHAGAAPDFIIDKAADIISALASDPSYLEKHGISAEEYIQALPAAIERLRGRKAAQNSSRRQFLLDIFEQMLVTGLISKVAAPNYAEDTVYRLTVPNLGDIAIIQKGCPDGAHSSIQWSVPDWATETYLWWLCPSTKHEPGIHVAKGVNRLKQKFGDSVTEDATVKFIDGVIFHNEMCGTSTRPCPKMHKAIKIKAAMTPPPCIYVFPEVQASLEQWNWAGSRQLKFPKVLLSLFGVAETESAFFTGHVGFQKKNQSFKINITSAYGPGKSTTSRS